MSKHFWQASSVLKSVLHGEILKRCSQHVFIIVARKIDIHIVRGFVVVVVVVFLNYFLYLCDYVNDTLLMCLEVLPMSIFGIMQLRHSFEISIRILSTRK